MTTSQSPIRLLRAQATYIAKTLKDAERGYFPDMAFAAKFKAAREKESFSMGLVMDDKVLTLDIPWTKIQETNATDLTEWIVRKMQGLKNDG